MKEAETGQKGGRRISNRVSLWKNMLLVNSPGMRIIKTAIAVVLCILIDRLRGSEDLIQAAIAAIVCLGQDLKNTWRSSRNRLLGTLIAGIYAYGFVLLNVYWWKLEPGSLVYLLLLGLLSIPLMTLIISLRLPGALVIAMIIYVIVGITVLDNHPFIFTVERVFATFVGVVVAIFVNWFPPLNAWGKRLRAVKMQAAGRAEQLQKIIDQAMDHPEEDLEVLIKRSSDGGLVGSGRVDSRQHSRDRLQQKHNNKAN